MPIDDKTMPFDLDELMGTQIEKDDEDDKEVEEKKDNAELEIEQITKELERKKSEAYDISDNLPTTTKIDKEEFKRFQKALTKKEEQTELDPKTRVKVDQIKKSMDLTKASNISIFGSGSQDKISNYSRSVLEKTRAKDSGEIGTLLTDLMVTVKNTDIKPESEKNFLEKIFGKATNKVETIAAKQQDIETQIDIITSKLQESRIYLLKDVEMMDRLYEENLEYYDNLHTYIIAGKEIIKENNEVIIPQMLMEANDIEDSGEKSRAVQQIRDYQQNVNRFEKRVHDLEISRVISVQMMPQLKLIQGNDLQLADKVQDAIMNVIPLWRTQFVMALALQRQGEIASLSSQVSKTSDELITRNAQMLHDNTINVKKEAERSIVSLESLEKSQELLISTIEETLEIEEDARQKRAESEGRMKEMELQLQDALVANMKKRDEIIQKRFNTTSQSDLDMISG